MNFISLISLPYVSLSLFEYSCIGLLWQSPISVDVCIKRQTRATLGQNGNDVIVIVFISSFGSGFFRARTDSLKHKNATRKTFLIMHQQCQFSSTNVRMNQKTTTKQLKIRKNISISNAFTSAFACSSFLHQSLSFSLRSVIFWPTEI